MEPWGKENLRDKLLPMFSHLYLGNQGYRSNIHASPSNVWLLLYYITKFSNFHGASPPQLVAPMNSSISNPWICSTCLVFLKIALPYCLLCVSSFNLKSFDTNFSLAFFFIKSIRRNGYLLQPVMMGRLRYGSWHLFPAESENSADLCPRPAGSLKFLCQKLCCVHNYICDPFFICLDKITLWVRALRFVSLITYTISIIIV